jgi:hypothetical protein
MRALINWRRSTYRIPAVLVVALLGCLPIPHPKPYVPGMDIRVVGDSGPLPNARLVIHTSSKPYDVYHESFEVPLDSAGRAVVRRRSTWHWFLLLMHEPAYYATWCAAAPGHYSQREEVFAGVRDSTIVVRLYRAPDEPPPPGVVHEFKCRADRSGLHDPLHSEPDTARAHLRRRP